MERQYFGTDGIRGTANQAPMTPEVMLRLAKATGRHFVRGNHRHLVVVGKDTRLSGYMLEPALTAGFISMGMDVVLVGPMPTPAVAVLTRSLRADLGVMISASHNPYQDNGVKLFGPDGYKLSDKDELAIEARMAEADGQAGAASDQLGRARRLEDAMGRYVEFVKASFPRGLRLDGLKIVVDCAHGAAYKVAPTVLWELGAEVISVGVEPDGFNINRECGATATERMRATVISEGADLGIALDGDADRVMIADEHGQLLDGDQLMALIASAWHKAGRLQGGGLVATVMSNLGLARHMEGLGLELVRTRVGDRYVVEHMRDHGFNVGGEQSGHIILSDHATTGDGLMAALQVLAVLVQDGRPLSTVGRVFEPVPQVLRSIRFNGIDVLAQESVQQVIRDGEARLGRDGRLVIRKSGTEPVVRVMAEADDPVLVGQVVEDIADAIRQVSHAGAA